MTTLHRPPNFDDMSPEERTILERIAQRRRTTPEQLAAGGIIGIQAHWPSLLEANLAESMQSFAYLGALPALTKQAMHVGISMANACDY